MPFSSKGATICIGDGKKLDLMTSNMNKGWNYLWGYKREKEGDRRINHLQKRKKKARVKTIMKMKLWTIIRI